MEWLFSLALLPLLICGALCVGGVVLALFGIRRASQPSCHSPGQRARDEEVDDDRYLERL